MDMMAMVSSMLAMQAARHAAADPDLDHQAERGRREGRGSNPARHPSTANLAAGVGGNLNIAA